MSEPETEIAVSTDDQTVASDPPKAKNSPADKNETASSRPVAIVPKEAEECALNAAPSSPSSPKKRPAETAISSDRQDARARADSIEEGRTPRGSSTPAKTSFKKVHSPKPIGI